MPPPRKKKTSGNAESVTSASKTTPSTSRISKSKCLPPRSVTFLNELRRRELGLGYAQRFPEKALDLKVLDFQRVRKRRFGKIFDTGYILRPGKNALICAWGIYTRTIFGCGAGLLHYDLSKVSAKTGYITVNRSIFDACQLQVNPDCFVCVTNHGELHVATLGSRESNEYTTYNYNNPDQPFWSCNSNFFTEKVAVGSDQEIYVYSVNGLQESRSVRDSVYTLSYNNSGTVLHMGSETGEFSLYDLRTNQNNVRVKVDENQLNYVLVLNNENYCIISSISGCLCQIDLRMQSVVVNYSHHNPTIKTPISVNEGCSLLCSSGADDVTRIWCLNTGKFLHSFHAPGPYNALSCLVPDSPTGDIHLVQDNYIHVYNMLR